MRKSNLLKIKQPEVGKLIKEIRQKMDLTQEQFAAELGVVYPTINRWENSKTQPSPMALKLLEYKLKDLGEQGDLLLHKYLSKISP